MYHIRPLSVVPDTIDLPKCMYHIKPMNGVMISSSEGRALSPSKRVKMDPELEAVEVRQLEVISRLRQMRDKVDDLIGKVGNQACGQKSSALKKSTVSASSLTKSTLSGGSEPEKFTLTAELPSELVIEANPSRPPLSLLFFLQLHPSLRTASHTHSLCKQEVSKKLVSMFSHDQPKTSSTIRVVWKNGSSSRLTPLSLGSSVVEGESNVARYLSRVLCTSSAELNYDALPLEDLVLVDAVLESSEAVDSAPENFLRSLQAYVHARSSNGAGAASSRTIADFVGYSTLRYLTSQKASHASLQKSLVDWMNCVTNEVPVLS